MEDVQNVLVAVAPITVTSRVVRASGIAKAVGFAIAGAEAELDAADDETR